VTWLVRRNGGERGLVPYYHPLSLIDDIEDLTRDLWSWRPSQFTESLIPHTDMYEEKGKLVVKTELPGIEQKELDITLDGDILTIKAEKKEEVVEDATHHTHERFYGKYHRTIRLPYPVKENGISATLDNGVLEIKLPRAEAVKAKKIAVKPLAIKGEQKKRSKKAVKSAR